MKIIGKKKKRTPQELIIAQEKLTLELKNSSPLKKKKGIIFKFKTWEEHETFSLERYSKYCE